jgi:hypothetical protein
MLGRGATLPRLTGVEAALHFDTAGRGRILQTFGDARSGGFVIELTPQAARRISHR